MSLPRPEPPDAVRDAARARSEARAARDWERADSLRADIEAAGWRIVDRGLDFTLEPAAPPTVEVEGSLRYGAAAAVPSPLGEAATARFTVVTVAHGRPASLARLLGGLRDHAPAGTQVVVVADDPSPGQAIRLAAGSADLAAIRDAAPEVVATSVRLGRGAALEAGLRRAMGSIVVLAGTGVEPVGDALGPLEAALDDRAVAVAGAFGLVSGDLRRFEAAPGPLVDVIELDWLALRRDDLAGRGPLDEKVAASPYLDAWWSLALRAGSGDGVPPRAAFRLDLPLVRHEEDGETAAGGDLERLARRSYYRLLQRFRGRPDLLSGRGAPSTASSARLRSSPPA